MKKFKVLAALAVATLVSAPVFAADMAEMFKTPYAGATINFQTIDGDGESVNPMALSLTGGAFVHEMVAVEARLGFGIVDDSIEVGGTDVDVGMSYSLSLLARGVYTIDQFQPYVALGFSTAKVTAEWDGGDDSQTESGLTFGIGLDYKVQDNIAVNLEYLSLVNGDDYDVSSINLGAKYLF